MPAGPSESLPSNRLLIVDDDPGSRGVFSHVAEELGFAVEEASDKSEFIESLDRQWPTAILLDLCLPGVDGIELLGELARRDSRASIIVVSGQDKRILQTARRLGRMQGLQMGAVLNKPVSVPMLETALKGVMFDPPWITRDALKRAIEGDELVLHFQPKVAMRREQNFPIVGCEALVRWNHPERGMVPPGEFISQVEEYDLMGELTEVVLRKAIEELLGWQSEGVSVPVSVNLSPRQLSDLHLPDRIINMLAEKGLSPSSLVMEITEQAAMDDVAKASEILTRLRLKHVSVSLDDFGAGYSSLVEIYRMPLTELKFDRSLITDLDHDGDARTVVRALVSLARELNLPVCAEGIETQEAAAFLQDVGCARGQGFLFSKPVPSGDFLNLIRSHPMARATFPPSPGVLPAEPAPEEGHPTTH